MDSGSTYTKLNTGTEGCFISQYSPLVKRIAYHLLGHLPKFIQVDDLFQAGMLGLLEAARNYDPGKGASFTTYASIRIRGAMLDEVRKNDWLPRSVYRNARMIAGAVKTVENRKGSDAKDAEIADELGVSLHEYQQMNRDTHVGQLSSFDDVNHGEIGTIENIQEPLANVQREDFYNLLMRAIDTLPERERLVLAFYYDKDLNLKQIGSMLGLTESRVCQIRTQAMLKIQAKLPENLARP